MEVGIGNEIANPVAISQDTTNLPIELVKDHNDDGYNWKDYQDDENEAPARERNLPRVDVAVNVQTPFYANPFPCAVRASLQADEKTVVCSNKCDVDAIYLYSSSLYKVVFRLAKSSAKFLFKTKINRHNVDSSSRLYQKRVVNQNRAASSNFNPLNRSKTGRQISNRICSFANVSLAEVTIESRM
jgi:hypothetical protein